MAKSTIEIVREVAADYNVPEWVWRPIMGMESGGNPNSWNDPRKNGGKEDSRGLFQINLKAHPQWSKMDLFNPEVNARIAFPNFIVPAWNKVKSDAKLSAPEKTAFVWRYGIRPAWNDDKNKAIQDSTVKLITAAQKTGETVGWTLPYWNNPGSPGGMTPEEIAPGPEGTPGGLGPGIKENIDRMESDPNILTIVPKYGLFPGIHMQKSTLFTSMLWIVGIVTILGLLFMIAKGAMPKAEGSEA